MDSTDFFLNANDNLPSLLIVNFPFLCQDHGRCRTRTPDAVRYIDAKKERRHQALEEMRRISYETGMDDLDFADEYLSQFD